MWEQVPILCQHVRDVRAAAQLFPNRGRQLGNERQLVTKKRQGRHRNGVGHMQSCRPRHHWRNASSRPLKGATAQRCCISRCLFVSSIVAAFWGAGGSVPRNSFGVKDELHSSVICQKAWEFYAMGTSKGVVHNSARGLWAASFFFSIRVLVTLTLECFACLVEALTAAVACLSDAAGAHAQELCDAPQNCLVSHSILLCGALVFVILIVSSSYK